MPFIAISKSARKYARALGELTAELDKAGQEAVLSDFAKMKEALVDDKEVFLSLTDPQLSRPLREKVVMMVLGKKKLRPFVKNFALLLANNNRVSLFPEIVLALEEFQEAKENRVRATVATPYALDEPSRAELTAKVAKLTGKTPILEETVDSALIGGARIRVGDKVWDFTVKSNIDLLKRQLDQNLKPAIFY